MKNLLFAFFVMLCTIGACAQSFKVGDFYNKDGLKGIVIRVDASGEHGLIMSLEKSAKKWLKEGDEKFNTNAFFEDDGEKNMVVIEKYINENGKSWSMFPYFEWCRSLGSGWYAPAVDELKDILKTINGGEGKYNSKFMKKITKTLKKAKGDKLTDSGLTGTNEPHWMYSSTEGDAGMVYTLNFEESTSSSITRHVIGGIAAFAKPKGTFSVKSLPKTHTGGKLANRYGSRAVHKF